MGTEWDSAQKVNPGKAAPARIRIRNLSTKSPALYQQAIPALWYMNGNSTVEYLKELILWIEDSMADCLKKLAF